MLIHRIAAQLYTAEALQTVEAGLDAGEDVTLAVSQSGRTLMAAAQFARRPRPTVYIVSGEDAADRAARSLAAYVGLAHVCRFPERKDYPWREQAPDDAVVAQRCEALGRIVRGDNCIMVASARALLRCVPPVESRYWESTTFAVGEEIPFDEVPQRLVGMGYTNAGAADLQKTSMGFTSNKQTGDEMAEIKRLFTPEFRNRLDATISFAPLDHEIILRVVDKFLMQLEEQLHEKKVEAHFSDAVKEMLAAKGFDPLMGARPMARLIQDTIRSALADELLFGKLASGGKVTVELDKDGKIRLDFEEEKAEVTV